MAGFQAISTVLETTKFTDWEALITQKEQDLSDSLADGFTAAQHLDRLQDYKGKLRTDVATLMIRDGDGIIEEILRYFTHAPNPTQLAVAVYAVGMLTTKRHQLWSLPAGTGKSRIIACAALVYLKTRLLGQVHIVIPSKLLKDRDENMFALLWELGSVKDRV